MFVRDGVDDRARVAGGQHLDDAAVALLGPEVAEERLLVGQRRRDAVGGLLDVTDQHAVLGVVVDQPLLDRFGVGDPVDGRGRGVAHLEELQALAVRPRQELPEYPPTGATFGPADERVVGAGHPELELRRSLGGRRRPIVEFERHRSDDRTQSCGRPRKRFQILR
nr:hypothetical protein [Halosimplex rubrum]